MTKIGSSLIIVVWRKACCGAADPQGTAHIPALCSRACTSALSS